MIDRRRRHGELSHEPVIPAIIIADGFGALDVSRENG
jgi:hypothetical protein